MARLAVFTDRLPDDPSWKGAFTWDIIRSLAESQHEVLVLTTQDPDRVPVTHPRLTVARPAPAFTVDKLPRWTQAILSYRPEIIHTFALQPSGVWPSLSVWPYMDAACKVFPGTKRISTMFDAEDFVPSQAAQIWHAGSHSWTLFSQAHEAAARSHFQGRIDVIPLEDLPTPSPSDESDWGDDGERGFTFVPAPVSEWRHVPHGLSQLATYLVHRPKAHVLINGGWGDLSLNERRRGWSLLMEVSPRVRLLEPQSLYKFAARMRDAARIWVEGVPADSWRYLISAQLARATGKELIGDQGSPLLPAGSTANFMSRIYLT